MEVVNNGTTMGGILEHIQSFEDGVPENWEGINCQLETSKKHYKHGAYSLKWEWNRNSKIVVKNEVNIEHACKQPEGGFIAWIYNEKPIKDCITFRLGQDSGYTFSCFLDFRGWRALWIGIQYDGIPYGTCKEEYPMINQMEIIAPTEQEEGALYFDLVEFVDELSDSRSRDYQFPYQRTDLNHGLGDIWSRTYYYVQKEPKDTLETDLCEADFEIIMNRVDQWVYGIGKYLDQEPMIIRRNALDEYIARGVKLYETLHIVREEDGTITGDPLFSSRSPHILNHDFRKKAPRTKEFGKDVSTEIFLPLVFDYKLNHNQDSFIKLMDLFDYYYDQGWAEGSGLGTLNHETNRSSGYFVSVYLMRKELKETGRFTEQIGAMKWFTEIGKIYGTYRVDYTETTVDEMRTHFLYRLLYVLGIEDAQERVCAMRAYVTWIQNALEIRADFSGGIKPDYIGYHHRSIYMSAYAPQGYHMVSMIQYLLQGTAFEICKTKKENLRNALLTQDIVMSQGDVPIGLIGRFPHPTRSVGIEILPAYAYMALSGNPIDVEMAGIFMRNWHLEHKTVQEQLFKRSIAEISYVDTLGAMEAMLEVVEMNLEATKPQTGFWAKPFGGLAVQRQNEWMVLVKGWSQYIFDFESGGKKQENVYGRYVSYGSMQILTKGNPITLDGQGFDWNRIPGTTTKHLPLSLLVSSTNNYAHRSFTDQTFLGAVQGRNGEGVWAMHFHDTQYDISFYGKKSVFFFSNQIVCMGTEIKNEDQEYHTETTLFQCKIEVGKDSYQKMIKKDTTWVLDPEGNGYYVPKGNELHIEEIQNTNGMYAVAWIDHGINPKGESYEYAMIPQKNQRIVEYEVLQKDGIAHIVKDICSHVIGYSIFDINGELNNEYLVSTDTPILLMIEPQENNQLIVSLCDPDLRLPKLPNSKMDDKIATTPTQRKDTTIVIRGQWKLKEAVVGISVIDCDEIQTKLRFSCINGETRKTVLLKE